jgi:ABC-2 type transport system permease protein
MNAASIERVRAIIRKEWIDLRRNRSVVGGMIALPLVMTAMASGLLAAASKAVASARAPTGPSSMERVPAHIAALTNDPRDAPILAMTFTALMLFSIVPVVLPSIAAAHSIVGEKHARSLEPLLATPVRTWELVVGKIVAIVIPVLIPSFVGYAIYCVVAWRAAPPVVFHLVVSPSFLLAIGLVGPLASVLAVTFGVMVSSRASDLQAAQGMAGLLALPVIALGMGQLFGAVSLTVGAVLARALVLAVIDAGMVLLCISVFERETILGRWK